MTHFDRALLYLCFAWVAAQPVNGEGLITEIVNIGGLIIGFGFFVAFLVQCIFWIFK